VGRDAAIIAKGIHLDVPPATRLLWGVVPNDHPFVWTEQLMPVLPVTFTADVDSAIEWPTAPRRTTIIRRHVLDPCWKSDPHGSAHAVFHLRQERRDALRPGHG